MDRRSFIKFMGASSATIAASTSLAKIPEAASKIILLDKPKDIIIAKDLPDVDFVVEHLISIYYTNNENIQVFESVGMASQLQSAGYQNIDVVIEYELINDKVNLFKKMYNPRTFTFNLKTENSKYAHLMELNGRKFTLAKYTVEMSSKSIMRIQAEGIEILC